MAEVKAKPAPLLPEDRILWNRVARSATPLPGRRLESGPEPDAAQTGAAEQFRTMIAEAGAPPVPPRTAVRPVAPVPLDTPTRDKIAKGRVALEARVDLHGLTQAEAHGLLLSFLGRARTAGVRHVLVITGKGSASRGDGILRKAVPAWFATAPFRPLVGAFDVAARHHGGEGAIYVRLKRLQSGERV